MVVQQIMFALQVLIHVRVVSAHLVSIVMVILMVVLRIVLIVVVVVILVIVGILQQVAELVDGSLGLLCTPP